jgi:di/tricarboxylate transporter
LQIAIVLGLLAAAIVLFAIERISVDIVTLLVLIALVLTRILTPAEAFAGFSNDIIVILASIFVLSGAIQQSGLMDAVAARIHRVARGGEGRLVLVLATTVGAVSSFMNNTTATAVFVPAVLGLARKSNVSPSKLLMPVAFASILGGTCTLVGTSTNVAVSGYIAQAGLPPVGLFEITPIGLAITAVGIAYLVLIGRRLLPARRPVDAVEDAYEIREYLTEVDVPPGSPIVGQRVFESDLTKLELRIIKILRGKEQFIPGPRAAIQAGDRLLVEGRKEDVLKVKQTAGIEIRPERKHGHLGDADGGEIKVVELLVTPRSDLRGRTLRDANFRERYGVVVLAIYRHGQSLHEKLAEIRLRLGDLLLVEGPADRFDYLRRHPDLWVLDELSPALWRGRRGAATVAFFAAAAIAAGTGLAPLSVALLAAAVAAVLARAITVEEAYELIDWRLIILVGGMTAFGVAMQKSGAAERRAGAVVRFAAPAGERVVLAAFFVLTMLLTQPMSNAAAALVVLPVAMHTAHDIGASQRTFAIAIMLAASVSFVTPFEPACILVYGPGKYRFLDFVKVGALLTLVLLGLVLYLVPIWWPLHPA